jgi:uncharacterized protein (TIGR02217 family)
MLQLLKRSREMNNYHDIIFCDFMSKYLHNSVSFNTSISSNFNGKEMRHSVTNGLQKFSVQSCKLSINEFSHLKDFFQARKGAALAFRIRDPVDHKIVNEEIISDGVNKVFKIYKTYSDKFPYKRRIYCLNPETIVANFDIKSIDHMNGLIYAKDILPRDQKLIFSGEFDIWVRFNSDILSYVYNKDNTVTVSDIEMIEVQ